MKIFKSRTSSIINIIIAIMIIAVLAIWFQRLADEAIINTTLSEMKEIGEHHEYALEEKILESEINLSLLATYIAKQDITLANAVDFLNEQSLVEIFDFVYYIDLNGNAVSNFNEQKNCLNKEHFIKALENEYYISPPVISIERNQIIFGVSVPVVKNGEISAVLFAEISMNDFFEHYRTETQGRGDVFLVDTDLNFVFSSSEGHIGHIQIPKNDIIEMGLQNVQNAQNDIIMEESGSFYYDYYGISKVMVYMPIEMTRLALAINIESEVLNSEIASAVNKLNLICLVIFWLLIVLIFYSLIYHFRTVVKLERIINYDTLTHLPNMLKLRTEMEQVLKNNKTDQYAILIFNIENFQVFNELYGYEIGNKVLKTIHDYSKTLTEPSLITARIGYDKFAMFAGNGLLDDVEAIFYDCTTFYDKVMPEIIDHHPTVKCGRYKINSGESNPSEILSKVTLAHERARSTPGEFLCDYDINFKLKLLSDADITNKMHSALARNEFKVFLQPKFGIKQDDLVGAEALVRWIDAEGKIMLPNDFIPLFEHNGFITEIDYYVLDQACLAIKEWIDKGLNPIPVSVNFSRVNLSRLTVVKDITSIVDKYNIPHDLIEIEVTESASIEQEVELEILYKELHDLGFRTSIDDFGAGYSSLAMLKSLNVTTLKMDKSFFTSDGKSRRHGMLIDGIIKLSQSLGMYVVAEGIETNEQVELLRSMNCDAIQGYFYNRPMPIAEFESTYKEIMQNSQKIDEAIPLIQHINDTRFASSFVPCGIVICKIDEHFTIIEANDCYFDIIGYTREEVRTLFQNRGMERVQPRDRAIAAEYIIGKSKIDPDTTLEFVSQIITKNNEAKTIKLNGTFTQNEKGEARIYFAVTDLTSFIDGHENFQPKKPEMS